MDPFKLAVGLLLHGYHQNSQSLIASNRLTGGIPPWIGNLTSLSFLNNLLESDILQEFSKLKLLQEVDLHSNKVTGRIRDQCPLGHYRAIDLWKKKITGGIDEDVGRLTAKEGLEWFAVSYNPMLEGPIPESMGNIRSLGLLGEIQASLQNL